MGRETLANTVTITTEGGASPRTIPNIPWTSGMTAQEAMERAYGLVDPPFSFALQYYGESLGYLVIMIDGTSDSPPDYWFFYVNGVFQNEGVSETVLNDGDIVGFKYESSDDSKLGSPIHRARLAHHESLGKRSG